MFWLCTLLSSWTWAVLLSLSISSFPTLTAYSFSYLSHTSSFSSLTKQRLWRNRNHVSDSIDYGHSYNKVDTSLCENDKICANFTTVCPVEINRRIMMEKSKASVAAAIGLMTLPMSSSAAMHSSTPINPFVEVPLEFIPALNAYVVRYNLFDEEFAAIIDTGSPFLTVPYYCKPYRTQKMRWGCYRPERTLDSGYGNTIEEFDGNYGTVVWRKAGFSFSKLNVDSNEIIITSANGEDQVSEENTSDGLDTIPLVFGVLGEDLLNGSGGVFFGLIKETDRWVRPSFLVQTGYTSFCVDLRRNTNNSTNPINNRSPKLILSREPIIRSKELLSSAENNDFIPLVRDLKKRYGAPVVHYTAKASQFVVNNLPLLIDQKRPLYVIFDTGVSGMVVSRELFDGRYLQARKNREKSLWGRVEVSFRTNSGKEVALSADKPLTTPLQSAVLWKGFRGNLVVLGLAFLEGKAMAVDIDDGIIQFTD